jgi:hypothetical protein
MRKKSGCFRVVLVAFGLCAAAPGSAMQCELLFSGGPPPLLASKFALCKYNYLEQRRVT